jgi:hypothetical protein
VSGPIESHEQPLSSLEPDTIDNLAQPTTCNLVVMIGGNFRMEVGKGLVIPHQALCDDLFIDTLAYVVVKVDMVHGNAKNIKLEVSPDDMIVTLRNAITRRVQWGKTYNDIDPSAATSASTTAS